jgi:hypothetical protein
MNNPTWGFPHQISVGDWVVELAKVWENVGDFYVCIFLSPPLNQGVSQYQTEDRIVGGKLLPIRGHYKLLF